MAKYIVEVYELHTQKIEIAADSQEEAVARVLAGKGYHQDQEQEFIANAEEYSLALQLDYEQLRRMLTENGISTPLRVRASGEIAVPTIRAVEKAAD